MQRAWAYKLSSLLTVLLFATLLVFQNCSGLITGNPIRYERVDLRFLPFNDKVDADLCLTNIKLRIESFGKPNEVSNSAAALQSLVEASGFDTSYFYQEASTGKFIINGLLKNKLLKLNADGTPIGELNLPVAIYDQVSFGFSSCNEGSNQSVSVSKDNQIFTDDTNRSFALPTFEGTRDLKSSAGSGFEISKLTESLAKVNASYSVPEALSTLRIFDVIGFSSTHLTSHSHLHVDNIILTRSNKRLMASAGKRNGTNSVLVISRHNEDGTVDTDFGSSKSGYVSVRTNVSPEGDSGIAEDSNNRIYVTRKYYENGDSKIGILRLLSNGSIDTSWGTRGDGWILYDNFGTNPIAHDLIILNDGNILISATNRDEYEVVNDTSYKTILVMKVNALTGEPIQSFGGNNDGIFKIGYSVADHKYHVLIAEKDNGKIIVAHTFNKYPGNDWRVLQLTNSGILDVENFNAGAANPNERGMLMIDFGAWGGRVMGMIIQPEDQKILLTGSFGQNSSNYDFTAARVLETGNIDLDFAKDGIFKQPIAGREYARDVVRFLDPNTNSYRIILSGSIENAFGRGFMYTTLDDNGLLTGTHVIQIIDSSGIIDTDAGPIILDSYNGKISIGGAGDSFVHLLNLSAW